MIPALQFSLVLTALCSPFLSQAQFISSLPQCIQNCIDQSQFDNCQATDIRCLCRASAGNFLPSLVTCMRGSCDLDASVLLEPLQAVCMMAGAPIPDDVLQNAGGQPSSVQQVTKTVTIGSPSATGGSEYPTTFDNGYPEVATVTEIMTQDNSLTTTLTYPVTVWRTATISGTEPTTTSAYPSMSTTSLNEDPMSETVISQSASQPETTSLVTTTVKGAQTSSSVSKATKTPSSSQDETNSAPFKDTSSSGSRAGLGIATTVTTLMMMVALWM